MIMPRAARRRATGGRKTSYATLTSPLSVSGTLVETPDSQWASRPQQPSAQGACEQITAEEVSAIATDAYIYFYPLVTINITRRQITNIALAKA